MCPSVAAIFATTVGCRNVLADTRLPTRTRGNVASRTAIVVQHSSTGRSSGAELGSRWSDIHTPSHPVLSACWQTANRSAYGCWLIGETLSRTGRLPFVL